MSESRGSVPEKPESDKTRRRAFLIAGALLVAFAAIAFSLSRCDKGPTSPEGRPDPGPRSNEPPGLAGAPGPATRPATPAASPPDSPASAPALAPRSTRVVAEVEVPAAWGTRFAADGVSLVAEFDEKGNPRSGTGMQRSPDGRTWTREIAGTGPFALILMFTWDGEDKSLLERFSIDSATGPEVRLLLRPQIEASAALAPDLARLHVTALDGAGRPVEGATLRLVRSDARSSSVLKSTWTTDRRGEALVEVARGRYSVTVSKAGYGAALVPRFELSADRRETVVLREARARLRVRLVLAGGDPERFVHVDLRARPDPADSYWYSAESRVTFKAKEDFEFTVPEAWEHIVLVTGRGIAPTAVRLGSFPPDALEKTIDLAVGPGEDVEVRGIDGVDLPERSAVQIQYEGPIGQVLTATPELKKVAGTWRILHVAAAAGKVTLRVGDRDYRGALPATGDRPRVVELR
jgi:hypothetical protein